MTTTRSGIPTTYRHNAFRSRLEARWARFFDLVGWSWVYEPFDTPGWIPDFLISGVAPFLVEVGPCVTELSYQVKAAKPLVAFPPKETLVGLPGDQVRLSVAEWQTLIAGVSPVYSEPGWRGSALGFWAVGNYGDPGPVSVFPAKCSICAHLGLSDATFIDVAILRPCGHSSENSSFIPRHELEDLWAEAGSTVQWRP